jgi:hypothetical protein
MNKVLFFCKNIFIIDIRANVQIPISAPRAEPILLSVSDYFLLEIVFLSTVTSFPSVIPKTSIIC